MADVVERVEQWWPADSRLPVEVWIGSYDTRRLADDSCGRYRASARSTGDAQELLGTPQVEPLDLDRYNRIAEALDGKPGRNPFLATFYWTTHAVATLIQDGRCAIDRCDTKPTMIDHDHATGCVRGLVCAEHNNAAAAPSGDIDHAELERNGFGHMRPYLESPPFLPLQWLYVNSNGYFEIDDVSKTTWRDRDDLRS